ncbi:MAG: MFS transporter, partial [Caulobacteraceae bacterium]|nr:MFS transporter [Caulobacter sp.]
FYVMRFLLGVAEAGFIPGILFYLTQWFPAAARGRISAAFLAAVPVSAIIGGPVSGWILGAVSGTGGLAGWQWLFLIEAVPSVLLGIATLLYLDDHVADATWLAPDERRLVADAVARDDAAKGGHTHLSAAFTDARVWLLGAIYFSIVCGIYIVSFYLPTLIKQSGVTNPLKIGLLAAIPYVVAVVVMFATSASADRRRERRWHTVVPAVACGLGCAATAAAGHSTIAVMLGMTLAAAGSSAAFSTFWCMPPAFLGGAAAAAGIALVNSLGNIAGFVATFMVGWMTTLTHSSASALYLFGAIIAAGGLLVLTIPSRVVDR